MENQECRCGGMNPDCVWCGGTGYVKSREASKLTFWSGTGPGSGRRRKKPKVGVDLATLTHTPGTGAVKFRHQSAPQKPRRGRH
jgi:hypothetical protein